MNDSLEWRVIEKAAVPAVAPDTRRLVEYGLWTSIARTLPYLQPHEAIEIELPIPTPPHRWWSGLTNAAYAEGWRISVRETAGKLYVFRVGRCKPLIRNRYVRVPFVCEFCRKPEERRSSRQRACKKPECQGALRKDLLARSRESKVRRAVAL